MSRLIIVSNRLPVTLQRRKGRIEFEQSMGGLATGLLSVGEEYERLWIGWPGVPTSELSDEEHEEGRRRLLEDYGCIPVDLTEQQLEEYYYGFSNQTLWPLFHYFPQYTSYNEDHWKTYRRVNRRFADAVLEVAEPSDVIWVQDYHLMLLPAMIREQVPEAAIGFFLHIPFPSFETFRLLPWRSEIVDGLLGSDLIGFHTFDYVQHYLWSARNLLGHDHSMGQVWTGNRVAKVDSFPLGIDFKRYAEGPDKPESSGVVELNRQQMEGRRIILSVDRMDYTKGLLHRLDAFDEFLARYPQYRGRIQMIMVAVPSREDVREYDLLRRQVEEAVGRVNGRHGTIGWTPIHYVYEGLPFHELVALYRVSDVCLVTPLRDGMNLIAKEYMAARTEEEPGILVLSEMAGAAHELGEALIVNPNNTAEVAHAIRDAIEMPPEEARERARIMCDRLERYDVFTWAHDFVDSLGRVKTQQAQLDALLLNRDVRKRLLDQFRSAKRRAILFDYDGTLVDYAMNVHAASPDEKLNRLLQRIADTGSTRVVLLSGRDRASLDEWFGGLGVDLIAENGAWLKRDGEDWQRLDKQGTEWMAEIMPMLERFVDRTPGAYIEQKDASLAWHYRRADPELAEQRARELKDAALALTTHLDINVQEGHKVLEVKNAGITKGHAARVWLDEDEEDFILAIGDDPTDEELFGALPDDAYTIRVGHSPSRARWNIESVGAVRELMEELA
jgi:trehalose 6-phosphate synthase/phosphatase